MKTPLQELIDMVNNSGKETFSKLELLFALAEKKENEKQAIIDAYERGLIDLTHDQELTEFTKIKAEQYYNETYCEE